MSQGNFNIKIKNESDVESVYYDRRNPGGSHVIEIPKKEAKDDPITGSFTELEFDIYRKQGTEDVPVVLTQLTVNDPTQSITVREHGKKTEIRIVYAQAMDSIATGTPPNVEAGVKE